MVKLMANMDGQIDGQIDGQNPIDGQIEAKSWLIFLRALSTTPPRRHDDAPGWLHPRAPPVRRRFFAATERDARGCGVSPPPQGTRVAALEETECTITMDADAIAAVVASVYPGKTRLWVAVATSDHQEVKRLLDSGASVDEVGGGSSQTTPLQVAVSHENHPISIVELLLDHNADVSIRFPGPRMPSVFHVAVKFRNEAVAELLIRSCTDVSKLGMSTPHYDGYAPLAQCARWGFVGCVSMLLARGADVYMKDAVGFTALHRAAYGGHVQTIQLLLTYGANVLAKCNGGKTAEDYATSQHHADAMVALKLERETRAKCVAFAMALHKRLGPGSRVGQVFKPEMLRMVLQYV